MQKASGFCLAGLAEDQRVSSFWNEVVIDSLLHQAGRQQPLREDEVVEELRVKLRAESFFGFLAEFEQSHVAVEIAGRLSWRAEGATGKKWIRFAVWVSAGGGAYLQPIALQ